MFGWQWIEEMVEMMTPSENDGAEKNTSSSLSWNGKWIVDLYLCTATEKKNRVQQKLTIRAQCVCKRLICISILHAAKTASEMKYVQKKKQQQQQRKKEKWKE